MIPELQKEVAIRFRHLLKNRVWRKDAFSMLKKEYNYSGTWDSWRRSVYRYCKKFGIKTK